MIENWCSCGRVFDDEKRKPFCSDCIALRRTAKRLLAIQHRAAYDKNRRGLGHRTKRIRILTRDGWICQICLLPIPRKAKMGEILYGNVDHIIPSSKGGPNENYNFQSSHEICNSTKANQEDKAFKEEMREILQAIVRSVKP